MAGFEVATGELMYDYKKHTTTTNEDILYMLKNLLKLYNRALEILYINDAYFFASLEDEELLKMIYRTLDKHEK